MASIVTLSDVKAHLRYPTANTADDVAIQGFINAAGDVIEAECGIVIAKLYDETYDGGGTSIWLRHLPVISVENLEEGWGFTNYELTQVPPNSVPATSMFAYSIDQALTGKLSRRSAGNTVIPFVSGSSNIHCTYTAGRTIVPGAIRLATLELVAHWWQGSQQRSMGSGGSGTYDATNVDYSRALNATPLNQGVPYRIIELLKPFRRAPVIG